MPPRELGGWASSRSGQGGGRRRAGDETDASVVEKKKEDREGVWEVICYATWA
jgi:hypothetical protein